MNRAPVLLVNPNRMHPPIGPLGLEYVAEGLRRRGYEPMLCDLAWAADWEAELRGALEGAAPSAVGVSIRNLDDSYFASRDFILKTTASMIARIREQTPAPIVLGGVGFSIMPCETLDFTGATYGIAGEGDEAFPDLLDRLAAAAPLNDLPGLVYRADGNRIVANPPRPMRLDALPAPTRRFADAPRYFAKGGQAGLETKRGCNQACIYCADPLAKGRAVRMRAPESVAAEFEHLLEQGVDVVHFCDSEFNIPPDHARAVCEALCRGGIGSRARWYAYACPSDFSDADAELMARAGCVGINFGVDHADAAMLERLGRRHTPGDLRRTVEACRRFGITVMFDLLFGAPGETRESIARAVAFLRGIAPDRVGLSCGVRVYPRTRLAEIVRAQGPLANNPNLHGATTENETLLRPVFYVEAALGADIHRVVWELVRDDKRFFAADPDEGERNYNYNDNSVLARAIEAGHRGAYWDILRKLGDAS